MTNKFPTLKNAPILEAQVSFLFKEPIDISNIEEIKSLVGDTYTLHRQRYNVSQTIDLAETKSTKAVEKELVGHQLLSEDEKKTFFYQKNNLIFSELGKYHSWDKFIPEVSDKIERVHPSICDTPIIQITARYINQFNVSPPFDPSTLFTFIPAIELNYHVGFMNSSFTRFNLKTTNGLQGSVSFFQKSAGTNPDGNIEFILDISVLRDLTIKLDQKEQIMNEFADLRLFKNDIFFNLVTDKLLNNYR